MFADSINSDTEDLIEKGPEKGAGDVARAWRKRLPLMFFAAFQSYAACGTNAVVYMLFVEALGASPAQATMASSVYTAVYNVAGLPGGMLADRWVSRYWAQMITSVGWLLATVLLLGGALPWLEAGSGENSGFGGNEAPESIATPVRWSLVLAGMSMGALSYGMQQPSQAAFIGDQVDSAGLGATDLEKLYSWFYFSDNAGALLGETLCPILRHHVGLWACWVTVVGALGMGIVSLWWGSTWYLGMKTEVVKTQEGAGEEVMSTPARSGAAVFETPGTPADQDSSMDDIGAPLLAATPVRRQLVHHMRRPMGMGRRFMCPTLPPPNSSDPEEDMCAGTCCDPQRRGCGARMCALLGYPDPQDAASLRRVAIVFSPLPVFWALYYQQGNTFITQANKMDLTLVWGTPDTIGSVNDFFVCVLVPLFDLVVYPIVTRCGIRVTTLRRMSFGMVSTALTFIAAALLETAITHTQHKLSVAWMLPQLFLISIAEATIAVPGLEFAYSQCTPGTRATVQALWNLVQLGALLPGIAALLNISSLTDQFWFYSALMLLFTVLFIALAYFYRPKKALD